MRASAAGDVKRSPIPALEYHILVHMSTDFSDYYSDSDEEEVAQSLHGADTGFSIRPVTAPIAAPAAPTLQASPGARPQPDDPAWHKNLSTRPQAGAMYKKAILCHLHLADAGFTMKLGAAGQVRFLLQTKPGPPFQCPGGDWHTEPVRIVGTLLRHSKEEFDEISLACETQDHQGEVTIPFIPRLVALDPTARRYLLKAPPTNWRPEPNRLGHQVLQAFFSSTTEQSSAVRPGPTDVVCSLEIIRGLPRRYFPLPETHLERALALIPTASRQLGGPLVPNRTLRTVVDPAKCFMFGTIWPRDAAGGWVSDPAARLVGAIQRIVEEHSSVQPVGSSETVDAAGVLVWLYKRGHRTDFHTNLLTGEPLVIARLIEAHTGLCLDGSMYQEKEVLVCTQCSLKDRQRKSQHKCWNLLGECECPLSFALASAPGRSPRQGTDLVLKLDQSSQQVQHARIRAWERPEPGQVLPLEQLPEMLDTAPELLRAIRAGLSMQCEVEPRFSFLEDSIKFVIYLRARERFGWDAAKRLLVRSKHNAPRSGPQRGKKRCREDEDAVQGAVCSPRDDDDEEVVAPDPLFALVNEARQGLSRDTATLFHEAHADTCCALNRLEPLEDCVHASPEQVHEITQCAVGSSAGTFSEWGTSSRCRASSPARRCI